MQERINREEKRSEIRDRRLEIILRREIRRSSDKEQIKQKIIDIIDSLEE